MATMIIDRRPLMLAGVMAVMGLAPAHAQVTPAQRKKFEAWVEYTNRTQEAGPMTNATLLGFATDQVRRRQIGDTRDGFSRLFAVVIPAQANGIILAAGRADTATYGVHRTGTHLRRISSGRNINRVVSKWDGAECERDFKEQVQYWLDRSIS